MERRPTNSKALRGKEASKIARRSKTREQRASSRRYIVQERTMLFFNNKTLFAPTVAIAMLTTSLLWATETPAAGLLGGLVDVLAGQGGVSVSIGGGSSGGDLLGGSGSGGSGGSTGSGGSSGSGLLGGGGSVGVPNVATVSTGSG